MKMTHDFSKNIHITITHHPIMIEPAHHFTLSENCGAQIIFVGTVRNLNENKAVEAINYDGHAPMAEKVLFQIAGEAKNNWGNDLIIFIEHRLGKLNLTDISVIIAVSSPHRDASYMASRYIIEQIKLRLPIWKEEFYLDHSQKWLDGKSLNNESH
jgi:molybdopterin synthase catalytic subunit